MYESNGKHSFGRGWAINRIRERLTVPWKDALWLVLAGEDRDRNFLIQRRGVPNENIISMDRDRTAVERVRDAGGIAIHGDAAEIIFAWPAHTPIHALMLDFNCGLEAPVLRVSNALFFPGISTHAGIYINLQRGRDFWGRYQLRSLDRGQGTFIFSAEGPTAPLTVSVACGKLSTKNRAQAWLWNHCCNSIDTDAPTLTRALLADANRFKPVLDEVTRRLRESAPVFANPYRQHDGGVFMDGVVFTKVFGCQAAAQPSAPTSWWQPTRQKVTAALAVRTARLRKAAR